MINLITDLISFTQPVNLDKESLSVIESIAKIKTKINECINEFNNLENKTTDDYNNFLLKIKEYKKYCDDTLKKYYNEVVQEIEYFKQLNKALEELETSVKYVQEQSQFVQDLANKNQDKIDKATIVTKDELKSVDNKILYIQTNKANFICPEDFGCIGDGVTDDTENLQNAINNAISQNKTLKFKDGAIYLITKTLNVSDFINIEMNKSIIKAGAEIDKMINYTFPSNYREYADNTALGNMCFSQLKLNGNKLANYGIYIDDCACLTFLKTQILYCSKGIHISNSSEILFDHIYIRCDANDVNSIGIENLANDCLFDMLYIMDCHTGIVNTGLNHMSKVHMWKGSNFNNSVGVRFNGGCLFLSDSYIDSYYNPFEMNASAQLKLSNVNTYYNGSMYTSGYDNPIIFKFSDTSKNMLAYSSLSNCYFKGISRGTDLANVDYIQVKEVNTQYENINLTQVANINKRQITLNENFMINSENTGCAYVIFGNEMRNVTMNILKLESFVNNDIICKMPFKPQQNLIFECTLSTNPYFNGLVEKGILLFNTDGTLTLKTNSTNNPKYMTCNFNVFCGQYK